jgi:hypothetical protein
MIASSWLDSDASRLTPVGVAHLDEQGIDLADLRGRRRPLVRPCADWTERRPHLAGSVGAAIATLFLDRRWVARPPAGRGLDVTNGGVDALRTVWHVETLLAS